MRRRAGTVRSRRRSAPPEDTAPRRTVAILLAGISSPSGVLNLLVGGLAIAMRDDFDGAVPAVARPDHADIQQEAVTYLDGLYAAALRLTRDRTAAEDLVQDTYLKAVRFSHRFERGTNLRAWLFTILHNTFRNERRDAGRDPVEVDSEAVADVADRRGSDESPERLLLRATLDHRLQGALDALPDAYRQAVWLRDVDDFSYAEIAGMLGVPLGTVMSRIARGRRLLLQHLSTTPAGQSTGAPARRTTRRGGGSE